MHENCSIWQCRRTLKISIEDLKSSENPNKTLAGSVYAIKTNNKNKKLRNLLQILHSLIPSGQKKPPQCK